MIPRFLTYFDSNYAAPGIAMLHSLRRHCPGVKATVLCLDEQIRRILQHEFPRGVSTMASSDLAAREPRLAALAHSRTPWELYATQKPIFIKAVLEESVKGGEWIAFVDADTLFFNNPVKAYRPAADVSVVLSPHRFSSEAQHLIPFGEFNAGFGMWRHDETGLRVLSDWAEDCLAWCHIQVQEDGRFMNQGYLTQWPRRYPRVHVLPHPGFNLGPWNLQSHSISQGGKRVLVDGKPLVFFHYSIVSRTPEGDWHTSYVLDSISKDPIVMEYIYGVYIDALESTSARLSARHGIIGLGTSRTFHPGAPRLQLYSARQLCLARRKPIGWVPAKWRGIFP